MTACRRASVDLKGHWHVWEHFDSDFEKLIAVQVDSCEAFNRPHEILDILDDTTAVWNGGVMGYEGTSGWLNENQKLIEIGGEDLHLKFHYNLKNDTLFLDKSDGNKFIAIKSGCCNKQMEFFPDFLKVEIDLPILRDTIGLVKLDNIHKSSCPEIQIGKVGQIYHEFTLPIRFLLNGNFKTKVDMKPWLEDEVQLVPPALRSDLVPIVYSNRQTDYKLLFELLDEINKNGIGQVYFAFREKDFSERLNIWLAKIDLKSFDYQSFIKNNYLDYYEETGEIRIDIEELN